MVESCWCRDLIFLLCYLRHTQGMWPWLVSLLASLLCLEHKLKSAQEAESKSPWYIHDSTSIPDTMHVVLCYEVQSFIYYKALNPKSPLWLPETVVCNTSGKWLTSTLWQQRNGRTNVATCNTYEEARWVVKKNTKKTSGCRICSPPVYDKVLINISYH